MHKRNARSAHKFQPELPLSPMPQSHKKRKLRRKSNEQPETSATTPGHGTTQLNASAAYTNGDTHQTQDASLAAKSPVSPAESQVRPAMPDTLKLEYDDITAQVDARLEAKKSSSWRSRERKRNHKRKRASMESNASAHAHAGAAAERPQKKAKVEARSPEASVGMDGERAGKRSRTRRRTSENVDGVANVEEGGAMRRKRVKTSHE